MEKREGGGPGRGLPVFIATTVVPYFLNREREKDYTILAEIVV
jgi:hypothetical protein